MSARTSHALVDSAHDASLAFWSNALAGDVGPVHENLPQPGYYRMRDGKRGPWVPVAIWQENGALRALRAGREADAQELWTWCCQHPVPYEVYVAVAERGEPWPEDVPSI